MAAMTTALTEFSDNGNSRTFTYTGHTAVEPRLVIQKRKVASSSTGPVEDSMKVVSSTEDSAGELLDKKISIEVIITRPANGVSADLDAALVIFRDVVAGDEFTNTVNTQEWLA